MVHLKKYIMTASVAAALLSSSACAKKEDPSYLRSLFIMGVPSQIRVFTADRAAADDISDAVVKEWKRIAEEYGFDKPYSSVSYVNKKAYGEWVAVDDEFMKLLGLAMDYYKLTGGAFDITFAPLWPIWKDAASSKKMPSKDEITRALANMGSEFVQLDPARKMVRFTRPVKINLGGMLRGYGLERGSVVMEEAARKNKCRVELKIGGNVLAYGTGGWSYAVPDPFHDGRSLGRLRFEKGVVMSSSGRDHFVQIEGQLYSHILDLRTGYPLQDFSNLIVYYPDLMSGEHVPSAALAVMGKEKAFALLGRIKGAAALWIDGSGAVEVFSNADSLAVWEKNKILF